MINKKIGVTMPTLKFDLQRFDGETVFPETLDKDTDGKTYLIKTAEDLQALATYVNAGNKCEGLTFKLNNDIDLSKVSNFTPIGNGNGNYFSGTFDGGKYDENGTRTGNYTISNLTISQTTDRAGLFGYVFSGTIKNITLANVNVNGNDWVGGLIGQNYDGNVENCTITTGTVSGNQWVGGLIGINDGTTLQGTDFTIEHGSVKNCTATVTVTATDNFKGDLIGQNNALTFQIYEINFPEGVTANAETFTIGGKTYYKFNATVTDNEITFGNNVTLTQNGNTVTASSPSGEVELTLSDLESADAKYTDNGDTSYTYTSAKTAATLATDNDNHKITYNAATGGKEIFTISGITTAPYLPNVDAKGKYTITLPDYSYYDGTNISITKKDDSVIGAAINAPSLKSNSSITVDFEAKVTVSENVGTVTINGKTYRPKSGNAVIDTTSTSSTLYSGTVTVENGKTLTTTDGKKLTTDDQARVTVADGAVTSITKLSYYDKSVTYDGTTYTTYSTEYLHYISDGTHYYSYDYNSTELLELGKTITNYIDVAITGNTIDLTQVTGDTAVFVDADNKVVAVYSQNILKITDENTYTVKSTKFFAVKTKGKRIYNPSGEIEVSASATATALTKGTVSLEPESKYYESPYNISNKYVTVGKNNIELLAGDGFTVSVDDNGTVTFGELNTADGKADCFEVTNTANNNFYSYTFATNGIIKESNINIKDDSVNELTGSFVHAAGTSFTLSDTNWTAVEKVGQRLDSTTHELIYYLHLTGDEISYIDDTAQIVANYTTANGLTAAEGYTVSDNFYVTANAAGTFTISKDFKNFITYINVNNDWIEQIYEVTTKDDAATYNITVTEDYDELDTANISAVTYKADDANDNRTLTFGDGVVDLADGDNTYRQALTDDGKISFSKLLPTASDWNLYTGTATVTDELKIYGENTLTVTGDGAEVTATVTNGALTNISDIDAGETVTYGEKSLSVSSGKISATVDGGKIKTVSSTGAAKFTYGDRTFEVNGAFSATYDNGNWSVTTAANIECNNYTLKISGGEVTANYNSSGVLQTVSGIGAGESVRNMKNNTGVELAVTEGEISATYSTDWSGIWSIFSDLDTGDVFSHYGYTYKVKDNGILYYYLDTLTSFCPITDKTAYDSNCQRAIPVINDNQINVICPDSDAFSNGCVFVDEETAKIIAKIENKTLTLEDTTAAADLYVNLDSIYQADTITIRKTLNKVNYHGEIFTFEPSGDNYDFTYANGKLTFNTTQITKVTSSTAEYTFENGVATKAVTGGNTYKQQFTTADAFSMSQLTGESDSWELYTGTATVTDADTTPLKIYGGYTLSASRNSTTSNDGSITAKVENGTTTTITGFNYDETATFTDSNGKALTITELFSNWTNAVITHGGENLSVNVEGKHTRLRYGDGKTLEIAGRQSGSYAYSSVDNPAKVTVTYNADDGFTVSNIENYDFVTCNGKTIGYSQSISATFDSNGDIVSFGDLNAGDEFTVYTNLTYENSRYNNQGYLVYDVKSNGIIRYDSTTNSQSLYKFATALTADATTSLTLSEATTWIDNVAYSGSSSIVLSIGRTIIDDNTAEIIATVDEEGNLEGKSKDATNRYIAVYNNGTYTIPAAFTKFYNPYTTINANGSYTVTNGMAGTPPMPVTTVNVTNIESITIAPSEQNSAEITFNTDKTVATNTESDKDGKTVYVWKQNLTDKNISAGDVVDTVSNKRNYYGNPTNWELYSGTVTVAESIPLKIYGENTLTVTGGEVTVTAENGVLKTVSGINNGETVTYNGKDLTVTGENAEVTATYDSSGNLESVEVTGDGAAVTYGDGYALRISGTNAAVTASNFDNYGNIQTVSGINNGETVKITDTAGNSVYNYLVATNVKGTLSATVTYDMGAVSINTVSGLTAGDKFNKASLDYDVLENGILKNVTLYPISNGTVDFTNYQSADTVRTTDNQINYIDYYGEDKVFVDETTANIIIESKDNALTVKDAIAAADLYVYVGVNKEGTYTIPSTLNKILYYDGTLFTFTPSGNSYTFSYSNGNRTFDTAKITKITSASGDIYTFTTDGVATKASTTTGGNTYKQNFTAANGFSMSELTSYAENWGLYNGTATVTDELKIYGEIDTLTVTSGEVTATVAEGEITNISEIDAGETVTYNGETLNVASGTVSATFENGKVKTVSSTGEAIFTYNEKNLQVTGAFTATFDASGNLQSVSGLSEGGSVTYDNQTYNHTITLPSGVTADGDTLTINGRTYYADGSNVTISNEITNGQEITFDSAITSLEVSGENVLAKVGNDTALTLSGLNLYSTTEKSWSVSGNSASYGTAINHGAKIDGAKIIYQPDGFNATFTLENLAANLTADKVKAAVDVKNNEVTFNSDSVLDSSKVVAAPTDYTLKLGDDIVQSENKDPELKQDSTDKTKYTYIAAGDTAGYTISDNKIKYVEDTRQNIQISGLKNTGGLTVSEDANSTTDDVIVANGKVIVNSSAINDSHEKISIDKQNYNLELSGGTVQPIEFNSQENNDTYQITLSGTTKGYKQSGNEYIWQDQINGETFTISGLKSGLTLTENNFTRSNGKITFNLTDSMLPENPTEISISSTDATNYALDYSALSTIAATNAHWEGLNYIAATTASKWTASNENKKVNYTAVTGGNILTTISGVETTNGLSVSGNVVTVSNSSLKGDTVTVTNNYTLQLANDVTKTSTTPAGWFVSGNSADYKTTEIFAGYSLSNDRKNISYVNASGGDTLVTVSGLKYNAPAEGLALIGNTVTLSDSVLNQGNIYVSSGYTLRLANNVVKPSTIPTHWEISGTTAIYKAEETSAGYSVSEDGTSVSYSNTIGGNTLITVSGLKNNAPLSGIYLNGNEVILSSSVLDQGNVSVSNGYTLKLASNVVQTSTTPAGWFISGNSATYKTTETFAGYYVSSDNRNVGYIPASGGDSLVTVKGLKSNAPADGLTLSGNTVILSNSVLNQGTVTASNGYNLMLANDVVSPSTTPIHWEISGTTAIYKAEAISAGYTLSSDGTSVTYSKASGGNTLVTVSGLKNNAPLSGISLNDKEITLSDSVLNQGNVSVTNGYTLKLADDVEKTSTTPAGWFVSGNSATYKTTEIFAGYSVSSNNKNISYIKASGGDTLVTVTGLKNNAPSEGLSLSGKNVTLSDSVLNQETVTISSGYTLKLAGDVTKIATVPKHWEISGTTANYIGVGSTAGYAISNNQIIYQDEISGDNLITISGLNSNATIKDISLSGKTVTISANALDSAKTVEISEGYNLTLGKDVEISKINSEVWEISGGTANYKQGGRSAGYFLNENKIVYTEEVEDEILVTVTGLKNSAKAKDLSLNGTNVSISSSAVDKGEVTISDGFSLTLGKGSYKNVSIVGGEDSDTINQNGNNAVITTGADDDIISLGSGVSKNTIIGGAGDDSIFAKNGKNYYSYSNGDGDDVISGWSKDDTLKISGGEIESWNVEGKDLTLNIGSGSIKILNGVGASIATADSNGKTVTNIYGDGAIYDAKKTSATLTSDIEEIYTEKNSSVVSINGAAADSIKIIGNSKNNSILGGNGDDTLNGGAGNDTLTGGNGADVFVYESGKDVITDYEENDKIVIGSDFTPSVSGDDVVFKVGSNKLTVQNAAGKKITVNDEIKIYDVGKVYNEDKTALNLTSAFKGAIENGVKNIFGANSASSILGNDSDNLIVGGIKSDTLNGGKGNDTLTGGDGKNLFIFESGNDVITDYSEDDKISFKSEIANAYALGNDVIFETENGSLKVLNGSGKKITVLDAQNNSNVHIYYDGYTLNKKQTAVTINSYFSENTYTANNTIVSIDGSETDSIEIIGNAKNNLILGGSGNDTLWGNAGKDTLFGGDGADVFIFNAGKDVISDYSEDDKISINAKEIKTSVNDGDVIFKVGSDKLTVQNAVGKKINVNDEVKIYEVEKIYNENKTELTLTSAFKGEVEIGVEKIFGADSASSILGNDSDNLIVGGKKSDTLNGGAGNDTLTGGDGKDVFVCDGGNDVITDYTAGKDKIKISDGITNYHFDGSDVIFNTSKGSVTVQNAKDQKITLLDSDNKTSYWFDGNPNFIKSDTQISSLMKVSDNNFSVSDVTSDNNATAPVKNPEPIISFDK